MSLGVHESYRLSTTDPRTKGNDYTYDVLTVVRTRAVPDMIAESAHLSSCKAGLEAVLHVKRQKGDEKGLQGGHMHLGGVSVFLVGRWSW